MRAALHAREYRLVELGTVFLLRHQQTAARPERSAGDAPRLTPKMIINF
jgi:hypothetical protein